MNQINCRIRFCLALLAVPFALACGGCSGGAPDEVLRSMTGKALTLYEGLPHPMNEAPLLKAELGKKQPIRIQGQAFYKETLTVKEADAEKLRTLLTQGTSFRPLTTKPCGEFHADYALEWTNGGDSCQILICFSCAEVKTYGPKGEHHHDLSRETKSELIDLLKPYRKNRPVE